MRVLLDTHTLLWMLRDSPELSPQARALAANLSNEVLLSVASAWELAIKQALGKLDLGLPFREFMDRAVKVARLSLMPITIEHLSRVASLPLHHRDPFDRLLFAQALTEGVPILSRDDRLDAYGVKRTW